MAFFGIFILAWVALLLFILIVCVILFVFIPFLVISIVTLVKGIKTGWPRWTKILLPISASIVGIFIALFIYYLVWRFAIYVPTSYEESSSSEMAAAIYYLLMQIK